MHLFLTFSAACLYALSFPKFGIWWLAFLCLIPFFAALERSRSPLQICLFAFFWGGFHSALMGYWLFETLIYQYEVGFYKAVLFFCLFVWLPLSVVFLCHAAAYHLAVRNRLLGYAFVAPAIWVLTEFAKSRLPFMIPWGDLGYALLPFDRFVQIADMIGVYGISFLAVMVNCLIYCMIKRISLVVRLTGRPRFALTWPPVIRSTMFFCLLVIVVVIGVPVAYGQWRITGIEKDIAERFSRGEGYIAALVQGNYSATDRWSGMGFDQRLKTYLSMSSEAIKHGAELIVWPETVLNAPGRLDDDFFRTLMRWIHPETLLIAGGVHETGGRGRTRIFNSAFFISGNGHLSRYDKRILLPYAEAVPKVDLLGPYYRAPEHFHGGRSLVAISTRKGVIGTSICLEVLYSRFIRKAVSNGAEVLVNLSNDGWFGNTAMPYQHLYAAQMRAIENRRYLLRAANSGISAIITPTGKVEVESGLFLRQQIEGRILPNGDHTLFSRHGGSVIYAAGAIFVIGLLVSISGFGRFPGSHFS